MTRPSPRHLHATKKGAPNHFAQEQAYVIKLNTAMSVFARRGRYACLFTVIEQINPSGDQARQEKEYIVSIEVKQDGRPTTHRVLLPDASFTIRLCFDRRTSTLAAEIRQFSQSPGHQHGIAFIRKFRIGHTCYGPCYGRCRGMVFSDWLPRGATLRRV